MFFSVGSLCISFILYLYRKLLFPLYIRASLLPFIFALLWGWEELHTYKFSAYFRFIFASKTSDLILQAMCRVNAFLNVCECVCVCLNVFERVCV